MVFDIFLALILYQYKDEVNPVWELMLGNASEIVIFTYIQGGIFLMFYKSRRFFKNKNILSYYRLMG